MWCAGLTMTPVSLEAPVENRPNLCWALRVAGKVQTSWVGRSIWEVSMKKTCKSVGTNRGY